MILCNGCKKNIPDDAIFCRHCGATVQGKIEDNFNKTSDSPDLKSTPTPKLVKQISTSQRNIAIVIIGLIFLASWVYSTYEDKNNEISKIEAAHQDEINQINENSLKEQQEAIQKAAEESAFKVHEEVLAKRRVEEQAQEQRRIEEEAQAQAQRREEEALALKRQEQNEVQQKNKLQRDVIVNQYKNNDNPNLKSSEVINKSKNSSQNSNVKHEAKFRGGFGMVVTKRYYDSYEMRDRAIKLWKDTGDILEPDGSITKRKAPPPSPISGH